ncbi:MAG: sodium/proton-translocating pyrophosphatase, partial [Spirochaetales bacterium]|nr:sodium/proton-translocating pyrophosphatase [Spirochaetales bacterium]
MGILWYIVLFIIVLSLAYVFFCYKKIKAMKEGTVEMAEMALIIRNGANTFMKTEYKTIAIVVIAVAIIFSLFVEKTSGLTLILGALMSSAACITGMKSATYANVRTSNKARESMSIGETVKVALSGGSVSGLSVQAFGMLGLVTILIGWGIDHNSTGTGFLLKMQCNASTMRITTYSLGCSLVAMFNRVAGGNYTKAADISSDILAKLRHDLPEDDSRVPNVIADFIGDNVNDIAGNCSDLLESFVATTAAGILIASTVYANGGFSESAYDAAMMYPIMLAGGGLLSCLIGLIIVNLKKMGDDPSKELNKATYISAFLTLV